MKDREVGGTTCKIMSCDCRHNEQDVLYGKQKRLFNLMSKDGGWRCTVCGREKKS